MKRSKSDRLFDGCVYILLGTALILVSYPLIYIVSASFSDSLAVISGRMVLWPVGFNLEGYKAVFREASVMTGYLNSLVYTVLGTLLNIVMTILAAYPLSRPDLYGKRPLTMLFLFVMLFNAGMIPNYMLVRDLGLMNTRMAMIFPTALSIYNMIIAKSFFQNTIPIDLLEAAKLDGCSDFRFVTSIVLPLSSSIVAVLAIFYGIAHWNAYFPALLYLNDRSMYPLQLVLRDILLQNQMSPEMLASINPEDAAARESLSELLKYSLIVVASAPMMIIYPFVQKYFVKGMMIGAVKG